MPALAKIQTKKVDIREIIKTSHLNDELKEKFLILIPNLDKEQIKGLFDFIQEKENEIKIAEEKIKREESEFYSKILKEIEEDIKKEEKWIRKMEEENTNKKDEEAEEDLLSQLENL